MNNSDIAQLSEDIKSANVLNRKIENLIEEIYPINNRSESNNRVIITVLMMLAVNTVKYDYKLNVFDAYDMLLSIMVYTKDMIVNMLNAGMSQTKH